MAILAGKDQCSLTCKATTVNGTMHVVGPVEAWEGTLCTTAHGDMGICVDTVCTVSNMNASPICIGSCYVQAKRMIAIF